MPRKRPMRPPPGLKGKEIGLFYRDLQNKKNKLQGKDKHVINLKIPQPVLQKLYKDIDKIEKIAIEEHIHMTPIKKLEFIETKHGTDFISLEPKETEMKIIKYSSNINNDDDVIYVKSMKRDSSPDVIEVKEERSSENSIKKEYFVSNKYEPSTSKRLDVLSSSKGAGDYKYSYNDIITGTFEEKLLESLSKDIYINKKNQEINDLSLALKEQHKINMEKRQFKDMLQFRQTLPAYKKTEEILSVLNNNQVVVISGETGCGKSTQVPQIILDDAIMNNKGANVKILVTQPRRIAASSLAVRIAQERAESLGKSVGFAVRLEKVDCRSRGSIMFCTTGVLLVELETNQGLTNYSHIILDEVHERDCQIDLSMCMLRQVLTQRKDLKLILMSATIDADRLCAYFNNCPLLHIEGLAYPVKDIYLEDIINMTKYQLPPPEDARHSKKYKGGNWRRQNASIMEKDIQYKAEISQWMNTVGKKYDRNVQRTLLDHRIETLDLNLTLELLKYICRGDPGAVLVFLPGIGEITKLLRLMRESGAFPEYRYDIHPLHSKLSSITQHKIFERPPQHIRKIIIATNIAETSITVDDIVYVIDCGKMKYNGLNVEDNVSTLQVEWISKANMRQRRGRAGRCQPGVCYHLVTSFRAEKLEERLLPELQRSNLLEPVLTIKRLRLGKAEDALKMMPGVPAEKTIHWAVRHLEQCGALDDCERLTPLGWHLARLTVGPAAGKLLLLGALFGCLDRAASVAAVWGFKDPFQLVIGKERDMEQAKRNLALGEPSDHIAISEAIIQWELSGSYNERKRFSQENFLSMFTLELLVDMKKQFAHNLKEMGFLEVPDVRSRWENRNGNNLSLFKAIVAASLYPNIGTVRWLNKDMRKLNRCMRVKARTPEGPVSLHPSSVVFTRPGRGPIPLCTNPGANWLVYWLKQRSSELFLIDVTLVYTLPLLFFGELNVKQAESIEECMISISGVEVCCKKETTQLLFELRSLLDKVLASKIMVSRGTYKKEGKFEEHVLNAVIDLISAEDERVEYFDSDDDEDSGRETDDRGTRYRR